MLQILQNSEIVIVMKRKSYFPFMYLMRFNIRKVYLKMQLKLRGSETLSENDIRNLFLYLDRLK